MEKEEPKKKFDWFSEGILLAWVPVAYYFFTFVYVQAYGETFGIPAQFMSVTPSDLANFAGSLLSRSIPIFFLLAATFGVEKLLHKHPHPAFHYILLFAYMFVIMIMVEVPFKSEVWYFGLTIIMALYLADYSIPSLVPKAREGKGLLRIKPLYDLMSGVERMLIYLIVLTYIGICMAQSIGDEVARSRVKFLVLRTDPSLLFSSMEERGIICISYDPITKKIRPGIVLLPSSEKDTTEFEVQSVGPLVFPPQ